MPPILGGHTGIFVINPEVFVCFVACRESIKYVFNPSNPDRRQKK
jgi:hypothetical protein